MWTDSCQKVLWIRGNLLLLQKKYMKTFIITLFMLLFYGTDMFSQNVYENSTQELVFYVKIINPHSTTGQQRSKSSIPVVTQYGNLLKVSNITSCFLCLLDTNDNIIYETPLEGNEKEVQLPSNIEGNFELQIIIENICYYTNIQL